MLPRFSTRRTFAAVVSFLLATSFASAARPTIEQVNQALDIAELAAKHGMMRLSMDAVERALESGPPTSSTKPPKVSIKHVGARVNTSLPIPRSPEQLIRERIPNVIFKLAESWQKQADSVEIYETIRAVVLPRNRPQEAFLYSLPLTIDVLQPDRLPSVQSVGLELIRWARKADRIAELSEVLEDGDLQQSVPATLLLLLADLEAGRSAFMEQHRKLLKQQLETGTSKSTAEFMSTVGMMIYKDGRFPAAAADVLELAGETIEGIGPTGGSSVSSAPAMLLAAARCRFSAQENIEGVQLLSRYIGMVETGKNPDREHGNRRTDIAGRELYSRGLVNDARKLLGPKMSQAFERRYKIPALIPPSTEPIHSGRPLSDAGKPAKIVAFADTGAVEDVVDQIWVCSLDMETETSRILFSLPDFQHAGSPAVSPTGNEVAFDATFVGEAVTSDAKIYVAAIDGSSMKCLGRGSIPSWSPAGKRIAYSSYSPSRGVWVMRSTGDDKRLIDRYGWSGKWSPDGRMIAYTRLVNSRWDLMVYDMVEEEFFSVFDGKPCPFVQIYRDFTWSPDSDAVLFKATRDRSPNNTLFEISKMRVLKADPILKLHEQRTVIGDDLSWGKSGGGIVCILKSSKYAPEQLYILKESSAEDPVPVAGQMPNRRNGSATWMPDGRNLVYISKPARKQIVR